MTSSINANPTSRVALNQQDEQLGKVRASLNTVLRILIPNFPPEAASNLRLIDGYHLADISLLLRTEEVQGKMSPEALQALYKTDFLRARNNEHSLQSFSQFWKDCQVPSAKVKGLQDLMKRTTIAGVDGMLQLRIDPRVTPAQNQLLLKIMTHTIVKFWLRIAPCLKMMANNLTALRGKCALEQGRIFLHREMSKEAGAKQTSLLGSGMDYLWKKIDRILQQVPFYAEKRLPQMTHYFATLDLENLEFTRENAEQYLNYARHIGSLIKINQDLINLLVSKEVEICVVQGQLPQSRPAKRDVPTILSNDVTFDSNFFICLLPRDYNDAILRRDFPAIKRRLNAIIRFLESDCKGSFHREDLASCKQAHEKFDTDLDLLYEYFQNPPITKALKESRYGSLLHFLKEINGNLRNPNDLVNETERIAKDTEDFEKWAGTEEGLRKILSQIKMNMESLRERNRKQGYALTTNEDTAQKMIDYLVQVQTELNAYNNLLTHFGHLCFSFVNTYKHIRHATDAEATVKADEQLYLLEVEENAEAALEAFQAQQLKEELAKKKEAASASFSQATEPESTPARSVEQKTEEPPSLPEMAPSRFNTATSRMLFQLQACLQSPLGDRRHELQQHYAIDCLTSALEMYEHVSRSNCKSILLQWIFLLGYLALEQGATARFVQSHPFHLLRHDLSLLLRNIGVDQGSLWSHDANSSTVYHRYPWNFSAIRMDICPFALRCLQAINKANLEEFDKNKKAWMEEFAKLSIAVLMPSAEDKSLITRIEAVRSNFSKQAAANVGENEKLKGLSESLCTEVQKSEKALKDALELISLRLKKETEESATKALRNVVHHLTNFKTSLKLIEQFPQQRFLHLHLHMQVISIQYLVENLGCFLGNGWSTHSLEFYAKQYGLGEGLGKKALLDAIDIAKGSEYVYSHSGTLIEELKKLQAYAKEARIMGEGAIPAGEPERKNVVEYLQNRVMHWSSQFAELALALCRKHLIDE